MVCPDDRSAKLGTSISELILGRYQYITVIKVKWTHYRPGVAQRVGRVIALLFHDRGTRRGWVVSSTPRPHLTPGKDPAPILHEAGWVPGPVWTGGKSRPHLIRSRTVQPVVSRYTDWATRPPHNSNVGKNALHDLTLLELTVARFVGTWGCLMRYSNGQRKHIANSRSPTNIFNEHYSFH